MRVVVVDIVDDEPVELVTVPDDGLVKKLSAQGADPTFGERVGHGDGQFQWSLHGEGSIEFCWAAVVPRCGGDVYADFGSTEAVSISEGPAALVYCYLNQDPNGRRKDACSSSHREMPRRGRCCTSQLL